MLPFSPRIKGYSDLGFVKLNHSVKSIDRIFKIYVTFISDVTSVDLTHLYRTMVTFRLKNNLTSIKHD